MAKIAVVRTGGKQYLVQEGSNLKVEKLLTEAGKAVSLDDVLLVAETDGSNVNIGKPKTGTKIDLKVEKQGRARKVLVVHYKAKVREHKTYGHRQPFTEVTVGKIN